MTESTICHGNPQPHDEQRMTSLEIAELTGGLHKGIVKAIRAMGPAWEKVNRTKFGLAAYTGKKGRRRGCMHIDEFVFFAVNSRKPR